MEKAELLGLIRGHDWLWEQWWPALEALAEQAHKEVGGSFPSVFATTAHMVASELTWQARCDGQVSASTPKDIAGLRLDWQVLAGRRREWLEAASPLDQISYQTSTGTAYTNTVSDIALHLTSHAHFHRGQLASQFRLLGLKPPSAHLITFFRL
ncbi:MAG: damage-inducible protein DinB [Thermaceae bacterium]|nr:damage-inducible protein DinB [Thermaceae bacterium]